MYVVDTGGGLVGREHRIAVVQDPVCLLIDGINGNLAEIVGVHEILERLRGLLLVEGVIVDGLAHRRVLNLHRDVFPALGHRPMHLAE